MKFLMCLFLVFAAKEQKSTVKIDVARKGVLEQYPFGITVEFFDPTADPTITYGYLPFDQTALKANFLISNGSSMERVGVDFKTPYPKIADLYSVFPPLGYHGSKPCISLRDPDVIRLLNPIMEKRDDILKLMVADVNARVCIATVEIDENTLVYEDPGVLDMSINRAKKLNPKAVPAKDYRKETTFRCAYLETPEVVIGDIKTFSESICVGKVKCTDMAVDNFKVVCKAHKLEKGVACPTADLCRDSDKSLKVVPPQFVNDDRAKYKGILGDTYKLTTEEIKEKASKR